jgi:hypothetical protein
LTLQPGGARVGASRAPLTPAQQSSLAERIHGHEPSAEKEFVGLFSDGVRFLVLARTRDPEVARDLAQDVMLAVVRALRREQLRDPERLARVRLWHGAQRPQQLPAQPQPAAEGRPHRRCNESGTTARPGG